LYNGDQVIYINATTDSQHLAELRDEEMIVEFSYSASWDETSEFHLSFEIYIPQTN
jgi:hypothetical protein